MDSTTLTHTLAVFALFGLIWTIQLVHYPMFALIESVHWPRFHRYHSRNITFIVFPLMLIELLTALQLFLDNPSPIHSIYLGAALCSWLLTIVIFIPLHNRVANRPEPNLLARLKHLNWLRTVLWSLTAISIFTNHFSQTPS